jgi:hypothetical protein
LKTIGFTKSLDVDLNEHLVDEGFEEVEEHK